MFLSHKSRDIKQQDLNKSLVWTWLILIIKYKKILIKQEFPYLRFLYENSQCLLHIFKNTEILDIIYDMFIIS